MHLSKHTTTDSSIPLCQVSLPTSLEVLRSHLTKRLFNIMNAELLRPRQTLEEAWKNPQHINELELIAFFNYLRHMSASNSINSRLRYLRILDSRVCSCVIAEGRSSRCVLKRLLRRTCNILLASDLYVLPLWTISARIFLMLEAGWCYHPSHPSDDTSTQVPRYVGQECTHQVRRHNLGNTI